MIWRLLPIRSNWGNRWQCMLDSQEFSAAVKSSWKQLRMKRPVKFSYMTVFEVLTWKIRGTSDSELKNMIESLTLQSLACARRVPSACIFSTHFLRVFMYWKTIVIIFQACFAHNISFKTTNKTCLFVWICLTQPILPHTLASLIILPPCFVGGLSMN